MRFFHQETKYTCGPACMRIIIDSFGIVKSEKQVANLLKTNHVGGTWNENFPPVAEKFKLRNSSLEELKKLLSEGYRVIIGYQNTIEGVGHYAIAGKVDAKYVHLIDPKYGEYHKVPIRNFVRMWGYKQKHDKERRWLFGMKK